MNPWLASLFALVAGVLIAFQTAINSRLKDFLGQPIFVSLISFASGTLILLAIALASRFPLPTKEVISKAPWWAWLGGACGAAFVTSVIYLARPLGATTLLMLIIVGQIVMSLAIDHFALFGFKHQPISIARLMGVVLLIAGVGVIKFVK